MIRSNDGQSAIDYLKSEKRRFSDEDISVLIDKYHVGYMPEGIRNIYGDEHELAGRLIIPIYNQYGQVVALSSRDFRENAFQKFWHESFSKTHCLYGLNAAKDEIIRRDQAIVVEGEFDVQVLYCNGFTMTVGTLGSTLQLYQISMLMRYCRQIFLLFDGDEAGQKSIEKVKKLDWDHNLRMFGIEFIPVILPNKMDPDDYLYRFGKKDFIDLLKRSKEKALKK